MSQNQSKTKIGPYIKSSAAYGLIMGMIAWVLFAVIAPISICSTFKMSVLTGIIIGEIVAVLVALAVMIASSVLFFILIYLFAQRATKEFDHVREELARKEPIFYDGASNHRVGKESVGGWMFLYEDRLYYKSHIFNKQAHEMYIPLQDIARMNCPKKFLNDTTLDITLTDGRVEQFAVYEPKTWAAQIHNRRQMLQVQPKDAKNCPITIK